MTFESFLATNLPLLIKLLAAIFLGGVIGVERTLAHKVAGLRTYAIVSLGSCLLIIISNMVMGQYPLSGMNPLYVVAAIATGIGFICGGVIIYHEDKVLGITTAAGMWVAAGIGIAVGFGFFTLAAIATILTIFVFSTLWDVEEKFKRVDSN